MSKLLETPQRINFVENITTSDEWISWIDESEKVKTRSLELLNWEIIDGGEINSITTKLKKMPPQRKLIFNSLYMSLVASFENFLRQSIDFIANNYNTNSREIGDLLKKSNIRESARILGNLDSPPDHLNFRIDEYCQIIGSFSPNSKKKLLNPTALSNIEGLIKVEKFLDRLKIFDIKITLEDLGSSTEIKTSINSKSKGPKEAGKEILDEILLIAKYRNRIAHLGSTASDVSYDIYKLHRDFLDQLSIYIDKKIIDKLV